MEVIYLICELEWLSNDYCFHQSGIIIYIFKQWHKSKPCPYWVGSMWSKSCKGGCPLCSLNKLTVFIKGICEGMWPRYRIPALNRILIFVDNSLIPHWHVTTCSPYWILQCSCEWDEYLTSIFFTQFEDKREKSGVF